jgi:hypothetical protein
VEEVLDEFSLAKKVLEVTDFKISTSLHQKAHAEIFATAFGKKVHFKHDGVGPVDAAVTALHEGLKKQDVLDVRLTDYNVEIDTKGVDATVEVKMKLVDKLGNSVIARTTSPDILVASIRAFEKGFNILYSKAARI